VYHESCCITYLFKVLVVVLASQESTPPGWESIPGLLKRFTNTGSALKREHTAFQNIDVLHLFFIFFPLESGTGRPKSTRIHADPDPHHCHKWVNTPVRLSSCRLSAASLELLLSLRLSSVVLPADQLS
jgi:hypothetical protein